MKYYFYFNILRHHLCRLVLKIIPYDAHSTRAKRTPSLQSEVDNVALSKSLLNPEVANIEFVTTTRCSNFFCLQITMHLSSVNLKSFTRELLLLVYNVYSLTGCPVHTEIY